MGIVNNKGSTETKISQTPRTSVKLLFGDIHNQDSLMT
jgi:hypothetical protein